MRVLVVGAGLCGLTTAFFLSRQGVDVTVVDRGKFCASETSYANGSMLTPSLADPWNSPGVLGQLLKSVGREDSAMLLRLKAIPGLIGWGLKFLANSSRDKFDASFKDNAGFAVYSASVMRDLLQSNPLKFDYAPDGTIKAFRDATAFQAGQETSNWLAGVGIESAILDQNLLLETEPALADSIEGFVGGIHYHQDEVGNARSFCDGLESLCQQAGVKFCYETSVVSVRKEQARCRAVETLSAKEGRQFFETETVVIAAGSYSWPLGKLFGINVPVRPAKGYSLTIPLDEASIKPRIAIVDDAFHAAVVPLGKDKLRLAGTAEFCGFDTSLSVRRIENLTELLGKIYPTLFYDPRSVIPWCGLRPMTTDGKPIIGVSSIPNLFLNTGHGPLGWTLACGSGKALADQILGDTPGYEMKAFSPGR